MPEDIFNSLYQAISELPVIDAHEHLYPESTRTNAEVDVFTLFSHYTQHDLRSAGMPNNEMEQLFDRNLPVKERWKIFEPYWQKIKHTCFARPAIIAAEHFYGFDEISDKTCEALSEAIRKANTPGIYDRVLKDACRIQAALTVCGTTDLDTPLLIPLMEMPMVHYGDTWEAIEHPIFEPETTVRRLDDLLEAAKRYIHRVKTEGAVGLKMLAAPYGEPSRESALRVFDDLKEGHVKQLPEAKWSDFRLGSNPLRDYIIDECIHTAAELDLTVAVHTGYWGDCRTLDPLHMIPLFYRHPNARFDVFHLGYPWIRQTLLLGKNFPNVWVNLCWTHIISQECATAAIEEALDLLPINKISAFGGDYNLPVEKVYGHLVMAREDVAKALTAQIKQGRMTENKALEIAGRWFFDNPKTLYRLKI